MTGHSAAHPVRLERWEAAYDGDSRVETPPTDGWFPVDVPGSLGPHTPGLTGTGPQAMAAVDAGSWWLRTEFEVAEDWPEPELMWDRVATNATFFIAGESVATSHNAHRSGRVRLPKLTAGLHQLIVRIAALDDVQVPRRPRPRWRSALIPDRALRWRRTPYLGRIPTWEGALPPVGIIGDVRVDPGPRPHITALSCRLQPDGTGLIEFATPVSPSELTASVDGGGAEIEQTAPGRGRITIPHARLWWPHTHGESPTHRLVIADRHGPILDRVIGFATITADRAEGRFALMVNDTPVFVRGACWVPPDPLTWRADPAAIRHDLATMAAAGLNLVRITGTNAYEGDEFWNIAAELGMLVWQDMMLATFDPPDEPVWLADIESEFADQLGRLQGRPNVAAICGGTETLQQPTMFGLSADRRAMPVLDDVLPRVCANLLPGVPVVESSPSSPPGVSPLSIAQGVSHYFGVGGYLRDLDDARSAQVSFASECLAFGIPPEPESVRQRFGAAPAVDDPHWRAGCPRDRNVDWDFVTVTDHYVTDLFGLRAEDVTAPAWLELERAAVTYAMTRTFAAWRSAYTPTAGGIVLAHRDLCPGPGWGLLDSDGQPKAPLLGLSSVLSPIAILPVERGLDGLGLELRNDTPQPITGRLSLEVYSDQAGPLLQAEVPVAIGPRSGLPVDIETALGGFRDLTWAWRLGERTYRLLAATLVGTDDRVLAQHDILLGSPAGPEPGGPVEIVRREKVGQGVRVTVRAETLTRFVRLSAPGWRQHHGAIHLPPGTERSVLLRPEAPDAALPEHLDISWLPPGPKIP